VSKLPPHVPDPQHTEGHGTGLPAIQRRSGPIVPLGLLLAAAAAVWHGLLMTSATNDNFLHMTLAKQLLAGDWPVRDFFDQGWVLQYGLSAAAQSIGGDRLMSEALIVALAWAISTYVVVAIVARLTGSLGAALVAAPLLIVAAARGYSYPKGIVYAIAAALWWKYVRQPSAAAVAMFGAWAAMAFYWRPDHGIYVALGLALAVVSAHGVQRLAITRSAIGAVSMLALLSPFLLYAQWAVGLIEYARTGIAAAQVEHVSQGPHEWPLLRLRGDLWTIEPADSYAPVIGIRWAAASSADQRGEVLARYRLTPAGSDNAVERVRLSELALANLRGILNEPVVEDTAGIERGTGSLLPATWPPDQRWKFNHAWLRVRVLPSLDPQERASEIAVTLFYLLPIVLIVAAPKVKSRLPPWVTARQLIGFALFALVVDFAMLRKPFPARGPDAVVLSAVSYGICVAWLWRTAAAARWWPRVAIATVTVGLVAAMSSSVAGEGRFAERLADLAGHGRSFSRVQAEWRDSYDELMSSPPLAYFVDRRARFSLRLAAYVRDCVPSTERLVVLWFEPEVYYYGDRLMAQRHLAFAAAWGGLPREQQLATDRVRHFAPPIVLARRSAMDAYARASSPGVVAYVESEYHLAATITEDAEVYLIYTRPERPVLRAFGPENWPCFVREPSAWSRVGVGAR
jgi:hypothetical protein